MSDKDEPIIETVFHDGNFYVEKRSNVERRCGQRRRVLFERRHNTDKRQAKHPSIKISV